ncbi:MAG: hypothetical protein C0603_12965 [Denitrovibrio sp.]|nr:MAG: hypothetical protein C0603_12965 [Denitrovibrio sp.]
MGTTALVAYAGCAGDCITCHPALNGDKDHLALKTCINCHAPAVKPKLFQFGGGAAEECGNDCFECHQQWPKDGNHAPLDTCQNCHEKK